MQYITREDSIELLHLTTRTHNCLRRADIHTIGHLLDYPAEAWLELRNMGQKSVVELQDMIARLNSGEEFALTESKPRSSGEPQPQNTLSRLSTMPISDLGLSVRAVNSLTAAGYQTAADLIGATEESLSSVHNMGQKTVREVLAKLDGLRDRFIPVSSSPSDENNLWYSVAQDFSSFTGLPVGNLVRLLAVYCEDRPDADGAELCAALYRDDSVREEVCHALLRILAQREDGMSRDTLLERLPAHTTAGTLNGLLNELNRNREIVEQDGLVVRQYPTAMEYVQGLEDQRSREILLARLQGETLESLGKRLDITRERVRQITAKTLSNRPALREDRYQYLFEHYEFSREEFHLAFDDPDEVYHYLEMIRPKGDRKPIRELLADEHVSVALRRKAERAVYKAVCDHRRRAGSEKPRGVVRLHRAHLLQGADQHGRVPPSVRAGSGVCGSGERPVPGH